ncbi:hypothetical protein BJ875DRAFT_484317 [Amylocarpus encephaloides]|uniref:Uncharacterized protein n=1 Tax=Amylocarpus encephaloides TaxID=45428 RepID=A0A9P7YI67_9HELO|nr:hypothetical protein BJ875DRAFT_484317 [Amylocarpus encephaloides]
MESYRHEGTVPNPRVEIYDSHSPGQHDLYNVPIPEPYHGASIQTTSANDTLLTKPAYGAPDYEAPSAYQHVDPDNRLLPFDQEREDQSAVKSKPRFQVSHGTRVVWRIISFVLSLTIIGLIGHMLWLQAKSAVDKFTHKHGASLPAWPEKLKLYPAYLFLAAACVAASINFVALLLVKNTHFSKLRPLISIPSTFFATGLWASAVWYFKSWDNKKDNREYDLWSWTCTHKSFEVSFGNKSIGFGSICAEMTWTYYAGVLILTCEALNLFSQLWNVSQSGTKPMKPKAPKGRKA